ncbi:hypothetical protein KQ51_00164 [Candidatus Izimaplasma bacterium HR1]|nr:hypothetical protein KQ51_00164 [Candidatus Izimaplasma bacterium HR1]
MRRGAFYVLMAIVAIGIILLNTIDSIKYLTCEDPNNYIYEINEITETSITITVDTTSSAETFSDYVYHINEDTLYIGVKYTMNPLNDNPTSRYTFTIEIEDEIDKIILKGGTEEKVIFPE